MKILKNLRDGILTYLYNILLWLDEGINVFFVPVLRLIMQLPPAAGNAHYTVSQTLSELRERGSKVGCIGCKILTYVFNKIPPKKAVDYDHCTSAMLNVPENQTVGSKIKKGP
jgi:hypothetical protein